MTSYRFTLTVETERESGKFASRDEILDAIREAIEGANPDQLDGLGADGASVYNITDWSLDEQA
jgi:hypothetical protein